MPPPADLRLCLILPAAGSGTRLGGGVPKVEFQLGGKPVFAHALETFLAFPEVAQVLVCVPPARLAEFARDHAAVGALADPRVKVIAGSAVERYDTIRLALAQLAPDITHIGVHDAARPLVPSEVVARVLTALHTHGAVLPALPVADTLRRSGMGVSPMGHTGVPPVAISHGRDAHATHGQDARATPLGDTVPRAGVVAIQTPQAFERQLLERAYANLRRLDPKTITDDAGLVEALGEQVFAVMGDPRNLKLTRQEDWELLQALEIGERMRKKQFKGASCCG